MPLRATPARSASAKHSRRVLSSAMARVSACSASMRMIPPEIVVFLRGSLGECADSFDEGLTVWLTLAPVYA